MQALSAMPEGQTAAGAFTDYTDANASGVSWGAIFAGAAAAAALSLILVILGFGLGLSAVSPWANNGASATTIGMSTILWIAFTQIAASGLGGYLAGRLRVKWANVHGDEVYFRDTAHGFFAWAVASLATAAFLHRLSAPSSAAGSRQGPPQPTPPRPLPRRLLPPLQRPLQRPRRPTGVSRTADQPAISSTHCFALRKADPMRWLQRPARKPRKSSPTTCGRAA
ncbi:hypothetical protein ACFS07_10010 [Undibacterium arcticum]